MLTRTLSVFGSKFIKIILSVVILTPSTLNVCPQQDMDVVVFTCMTTGTGALLWIQGSQQHFYTSLMSMVGDTGSLGHFTTRLDSVEGLNLTSTVTTNVFSNFSLLNSNISNITIKCDDNGDTIGAESAVLTTGTCRIVARVLTNQFHTEL